MFVLLVKFETTMCAIPARESMKGLAKAFHQWGSRKLPHLFLLKGIDSFLKGRKVKAGKFLEKRVLTH